MNSKHPRSLEPEKAQLLDQNGFRRDAARDIYVATNGLRISESQFLVDDVSRSTQRAMASSCASSLPHVRSSAHAACVMQ